MPQDFWSKIGAIASTVVNTLVYVGQLVYKGLVALGTFLVNLAQAIADWGMKALGAVWNAAVAVAQKVGEVLVAVGTWLASFLIGVVRGIIDILLTPVVNGINSWMASIAAGLVASRALSVDAFADALFQQIFLAPFALAALAVIVAISVAEKIVTPATAGMAQVLGIVIGAVTGIILGLFITEIISQYAGSTELAELLPDWYDEMTGWSFGIAKLLMVWELKVAQASRPLASITGVEASLYLSVMSLLLLGVGAAIAATVTDPSQRLVRFVLVDVLALSIAVAGAAYGLKVGGGAIRWWYPLLYPISIALSTFSTLTAAFKTGTDVAALATYHP